MVQYCLVNGNTWKESWAANALIGIRTILKHRIPSISDDGQHRESGTSGIGNNRKWLESRWWPSTEIDVRPTNSNHSRRCHDDKFLIGPRSIYFSCEIRTQMCFLLIVKNVNLQYITVKQSTPGCKEYRKVDSTAWWRQIVKSSSFSWQCSDVIGGHLQDN